MAGINKETHIWLVWFGTRLVSNGQNIVIGEKKRSVKEGLTEHND